MRKQISVILYDESFRKLQVTNLEKLAVDYVNIIFTPKFHCEINPIGGCRCHSKPFVGKNTEQTFQISKLLIPLSRQNFVMRNIYSTLFQHFWHTILAYPEEKTYLGVLNTFFSGLCNDKITSHRRITNTNVNDLKSTALHFYFVFSLH